MTFDENRLRAESFVAAVEIHDELNSTNDAAMQRAKSESVELPLLIVAKRQTAGRGRGKNIWWTSDGALTFSLLKELPPETIPRSRWPQVSLTAGLAVCEAIQQLRPGLHVGLKWPNDVFVDDRKACGILIEVPPGQRPAVVIGVGINVNNSFDTAPDELRETAISLCDVSNSRFNLNDVLVLVLQQLDFHLELLAGNTLELQQRWSRLCVLTGSEVEVAIGNEVCRGLCEGIDEAGALLLQTATGPRRCLAGVVQRFDRRHSGVVPFS